MIKPKEQITHLSPYHPGKPIEEVQREYQLNDVIKLASNENPFGCSPQVKAAIMEELDQLYLYPEGAAPELSEAVAAHLEVGADQLIFGNGSDELIEIISRTFLQPGDSAVMADITFPRYISNVIVEGAKPIEVPLTAGGVHDLEAMLAAIEDNTKIVWVCNPNNPTGTYVNQTDLVRFLDRVPQHVLVVLDEAYYEYVTADDYPQSIQLLKQYPNVIILRTFSKIYGLAALRIGYGIAAPQIIDWLNRVREPFNTSRIAQKAALAAIHDQDFVRQCSQKNRDGKESYYERMQELNIAYYRTEANFIMIDLGRPAHPVFEAMLRQGMIVRSGQALGKPTCLRVTIGSQEQNERFFQLLSELVHNES